MASIWIAPPPSPNCFIFLVFPAADKWMDLVSGAKAAGRAPSGALPCSGSELNSWWAGCLPENHLASRSAAECLRVQPPEPLQRGKKKERESTTGIHVLREGEGSQYKNTTQNNPRYKDTEQEPTLFYKSSNMVSLGFSVLGSRSPWETGRFSHQENRIPVRNQLSSSAYQMYKYF